MAKSTAPHVCHCIIRHAITEAERDQVKAARLSARRTGDRTQVLITTAALAPCPSAPKPFPNCNCTGEGCWGCESPGYREEG